MPYERDTQLRRARYFPPGTSPWDKQLEGLTYEMEAIQGEPHVGEAVLAFARLRDRLPQ
jgi:hypothetical protein